MTHSLEYKKRRTRRIVFLIGIFVASLTAIEILIQQLNNPVPIVNNLLVFTLLNLNIILLVVLVVVVVRNLAKLYFERKNNILGSQFSDKTDRVIYCPHSHPFAASVCRGEQPDYSGGWKDGLMNRSSILYMNLWRWLKPFTGILLIIPLYFAEQISELYDR